MNRIDKIPAINKKCTGCSVCVDACPNGCIVQYVDNDGFTKVKVDVTSCIECEMCYKVCPAENFSKNSCDQHLFAAYSLDNNIKSRGSSGGIFELLASYCLNNKYYVCGAAFDDMKLKHMVVNTKKDLQSLLKSKYVQSSTVGIFNKVKELLKNREKVFFCGTPCQVSALMNFIPQSLKDNLFTADIICHGVPSQKLFDMYIQSLEKKHNGKIIEFSFRIKDNSYKHAHGYSYIVEKNTKSSRVNGIYTQSSFYNAFKNYLIFRDSCYECQYSTLKRVSDITLADFWGIEKYDFDANTDDGVSMIITNTTKGEKMFHNIANNIVSREFPIGYGVESNYCLSHSTIKPKNRDAVFDCIRENGYDEASKKYFAETFIHKLYWMIPPKVRNFLKRLRG